VRVDLALRAVAEAEGIEPTDDDLEQELAEVAERVGQPVDVVRSTLEQQDQLPGIRSELRQRAALAWLVERVEIVDPDGNPIDRADLQPPADEDDQPDDAEVDEVDHDGSDAEPDEGADDQ
jgi:trigger factor